VKTGILKTGERRKYMRLGVFTAINIKIRHMAFWNVKLYNLVPTRCHDVIARKIVVIKVKASHSSWQFNALGCVPELFAQLALQRANTSLGRML
jgi:hypothetical protein